MITVKEYTTDQQQKLEEFCSIAKTHGLKNNESLVAMKIDSVKYWVGYYEDKIIAVNGIERYDDVTWRVAVRQATLPTHHNLLGFKRDFGANSIMFRYVQRAGVEYAHNKGGTNLIVSTNLNNEAGPWMTRVDKHVQRFCDLGIFTYVETKELNYVMQNIYKLNYDRYIEYANFLEVKYGNQ